MAYDASRDILLYVELYPQKGRDIDVILEAVRGESHRQGGFTFLVSVPAKNDGQTIGKLEADEDVRSVRRA